MTAARAKPVAAMLEAEPYRFAFFQAVRVLEHMAAGADRPAVRYRTPASLDFPPSELTAFTRDEDGTPELTVSFLGLTGPSGVLPRFYTELLIERRFKHRDTTLHAFLDLFNQRLVELFYRAWEKHRFYVPHERGEATALSNIVLGLIGLGTPGLQRRLVDDTDGLRDPALVYYAGLGAQRPHSAWSLTAVIGDMFGVQARLKQFIGRWIAVPETERTRLGRVNCELGRTMMLGERAWECQSQCELALGPLEAAPFASLLPGGDAHVALTRMVRWFIGAGVDCTVRLVLKREAAARPQLGKATRLGYSSWLATGPLDRDPDDVVFQCP